MRAGLIIGGLFLMFVGIILSLTILFLGFGILCGLIGFVMLIVGLVTSTHKPLPQSQQQQQVVYVQSPAPSTAPQPQYVSQQQSMPPPYQGTNVKYCSACGTPNAKEDQYCGKCGKKFLE